MAVNPSDVLSTIKIRLKINDTTFDNLINSYIPEIEYRIKNYCNISTIPDPLFYVFVSMVIDVLKVEQPNLEPITNSLDDSMNVKIGDTQSSNSNTTSVKSTSKSIIDSVVLNYKIDLNRYRRLSW